MVQQRALGVVENITWFCWKLSSLSTEIQAIWWITTTAHFLVGNGVLRWCSNWDQCKCHWVNDSRVMSMTVNDFCSHSVWCVSFCPPVCHPARASLFRVLQLPQPRVPLGTRDEREYLFQSHSLPFPMVHSHSHSHETNLTIPIHMGIPWDPRDTWEFPI